MRVYRLAVDGRPSEREGREIVLVDNATSAVVAGEFFAVRESYSSHPAGIDLFFRHYIVDHMTSGRRVGGGVMDPLTFEQAVAFAESLRTAPCDWAAVDPAPKEPFGDFAKKALGAAREGSVIAWEAVQ
jgi:hypothetical protein